MASLPTARPRPPALEPEADHDRQRVRARPLVEDNQIAHLSEPTPRRDAKPRDRAGVTPRAGRGQPPLGGAPAADLRGRPARLLGVPRRDVNRRVHHAGVGDRPSSRTSAPAPLPRRCRRGRRRAQSSRPEHRPDGATRRFAGTFGVRDGTPPSASQQSPPTTGPTGTVQPRAREARPRGGGTPPPVRRIAPLVMDSEP